MEDIKRNWPTTLNWERRGRRGRRVNDLIEIWGGFRELDESSKALMDEKQGFHLSVRRALDKLDHANARANAVTRTFSFVDQREVQSHSDRKTGSVKIYSSWRGSDPRLQY